MSADFTTVTEVPGVGASAQQLEMLYSRYVYAASFCAGKDVLEVACGAGTGLGYLGRRARRVVGGDVTGPLLRRAGLHYQDRVHLVRLDAHVLPFRPASFDVVVLFEAIYYLSRPERFVDECRRVLRPGGVLLVCTVNKEWSDFNPSPFSTRYYSAAELSDLLAARGFRVEVLGAFSSRPATGREWAISMVKRSAVALRLVPRTMAGKQLLKRVFLGRLAPLPAEIRDGCAEYVAPSPIAEPSEAPGYKILYAVGRPT